MWSMTTSSRGMGGKSQSSTTSFSSTLRTASNSKGNETVEVPGTYAGLLELVAQLGGENAEAKEKFDKGIYDFNWKPMLSPLEVIDQALMRAGLELDMFAGFASHLWKYTAVPVMHLILKWPVIFIEADPEDAASMYSLRTYAGYVRRTWCPDGGLSAPAQALAQIAMEMEVEFRFGAEVSALEFDAEDRVTEVCVAVGGCDVTDTVIAAADFNWVEQVLLPQRLRQYDTAFWERQVMSPCRACCPASASAKRSQGSFITRCSSTSTSTRTCSICSARTLVATTQRRPTCARPRKRTARCSRRRTVRAARAKFCSCSCRCNHGCTGPTRKHSKRSSSTSCSTVCRRARRGTALRRPRTGKDIFEIEAVGPSVLLENFPKLFPWFSVASLYRQRWSIVELGQWVVIRHAR